MTEQHTAPAIYVASLSDYNAGRLHGTWIHDLRDAETIHAQVSDMLAQSPEPGAEEWAIHDHEGFDGIAIGEWESFETVAMVAALIDEHDGAFAAWYGNESRDPSDDWAEMFAEEYMGEWEDMADYAYSLAEDMGTVPSSDAAWPLQYVDWAAAGRDLVYGGDHWTADAPMGRIYVFRSV